MPRKSSQSRKLQIKYARSAIGLADNQKGTIRALGLKRIGDVVTQDDTPVIRGMVHTVRHLVEVVEVNA